MLLTKFSLRRVERWLMFLQKISNSRTSLCWVGNHSGSDLIVIPPGLYQIISEVLS